MEWSPKLQPMAAKAHVFNTTRFCCSARRKLGWTGRACSTMSRVGRLRCVSGACPLAATTPCQNFSELGNIFPHFESSRKNSAFERFHAICARCSLAVADHIVSRLTRRLHATWPGMSHNMMPGERTRSSGDGGFPIQIGGGFLYNTYPYVSCMYLACILHVFRCVPFIDIKIHQDTSRYIKIHQDTFVSVTLAMMMASKHSPNPRDMYPACIPHVFRMYLACVQHVS
jgi:hypothetical protein